jgi:hypothetical protein
MSKLTTITRMPPRIDVDESIVTATISVHVDVLSDNLSDEGADITAEAMIDIADGPGAEISVAVAKAIKVANDRADAAVAAYLAFANRETANV